MRDHRHHALALRFRPLTDHFAGNDEIETVLPDPFVGLVHHEDLAVQAGIQVRSIAVFRVDHDVLVLVYDVDDVQLDAELLGNPQRIIAFDPAAVTIAYGISVPFHAKASVKINSLDVDSLLLDQPGGEQRIKPAGDQRDCFFHRTGIDVKTGIITTTGGAEPSTPPAWRLTRCRYQHSVGSVPVPPLTPALVSVSEVHSVSATCREPTAGVAVSVNAEPVMVPLARMS